MRPNSLAAVALGALVLAGGVSTADGPGNAPSACYSYREAKARWNGAYLTWRYDRQRRQCWAPKGRGTESRRLPVPPPEKLQGNAGRFRALQDAQDIAPEFPQPGDLKINPPPMSENLNPAGMGWVWDVRDRQQAEIVAPPETIYGEIVAPPVTIYSTFDGEPPDVWPAQSKTAGSGLPAVLLLALMAGGGLMMTTAGLFAIRLRP